MQWLIDMIKEIIHGQLGFFNRGDPGAADFLTGDFTTDNQWRDLDLSAIVPADAQAVLLRIKYQSNAIARPVRFRKRGNINEFNQSIAGTIAGSTNHWEDLTIACDADRFIQYKIPANPAWAIEVTIAGWWLR